MKSSCVSTTSSVTVHDHTITNNIVSDGSNSISGTYKSVMSDDLGMKSQLHSSVFCPDYNHLSVPEPSPISSIESSCCVMALNGHQLLSTSQPSSSSNNNQRHDDNINTILNTFMQHTSMDIVDEIIHTFRASS
jgi:hypothetical protein